MNLLLLGLQITVLVAFGLAALFLKSYVPSYLAEKAKNLATKEDVEGITRQIEGVRAEYATQLETARAELRVAAHQSETRFAYLHELRADAIVELYKRLVRTEELFQGLAGGFRFPTGATTEEVAAKAVEAGNDLMAFYYDRRLFFDIDFIKAFEELRSTMMTAYTTIILDKEEDPRGMTREERREGRDRLRGAQKRLREELPRLISILEGQMRGLLEGEVTASEQRGA